jgi:hypothetical protein
MLRQAIWSPLGGSLQSGILAGGLTTPHHGTEGPDSIGVDGLTPTPRGLSEEGA